MFRECFEDTPGGCSDVAGDALAPSKDFDGAGRHAKVDFLANQLMGDAVVGIPESDVVIDVYFRLFPVSMVVGF
jgi:hypothetical protein